jgi:hypothetical protein
VFQTFIDGLAASADIPVIQPTKVEMFIILKAAKGLA